MSREQHLLWRISKPKNVPLTFRIEHDKASSALAKQVADTAGAIVKRLGIGELVNVTTVPVEPVAETVFLGRWSGATRGDIQAMDIRPDIPVILCTGHSDKVTQEMARDAGIREFVMKPMTIQTLAETVRSALDNRPA